MFKKMMLLASMALAAVAFAVPASASAFEWTDEGAPVEGEAPTTASGFLSFGNPAPGQNKFGCVVDVGITAEEAGAGKLTEFSPTTSTCKGEGPAFAKCSLKEDSITGLPATVTITGTNTLTINGTLVLHNVYSGPECPVEKSTLTVSDATITLENSNLTKMTLSGFGEAHTTVGGVTTSATVALFGSLTGTDTLTVS